MCIHNIQFFSSPIIMFKTSKIKGEEYYFIKSLHIFICEISDKE